VMDLTRSLVRFAERAFLGPKAWHNVAAKPARDPLGLVFPRGVLLPSPFHAPATGDQWVLRFASVNRDLQHVAGAMAGGNGLPGLLVKLPGVRLALMRQRHHQRDFPHPMPPPEARHVARPQVVLPEAPIRRLVRRADTAVRISPPVGTMDRFTLLHVPGAFRLDDIHGDLHPRSAMDTTLTALVVCRVGVQCADLGAKEPRRLWAGVGHQRLLFGEFQLEVISSEHRPCSRDLLSCLPWTTETEPAVIRLPNGPESPEVGGRWVTSWQLLGWLPQQLCVRRRLLVRVPAGGPE
jgi:hypothetical protein